MRTCEVIAVGNQKGGCGKSINAMNVAAGLAELGYKTLLIDLDPQHTSTTNFGIDPTDLFGSNELITREYPPLNLVIGPDDPDHGKRLPENLSLIPCRRNQDRVEGMFDQQTQQGGGSRAWMTQLLNEQIEELAQHFDFILLDTPPQPLSPRTIGAYAAANWALLSIMASPNTFVGMINAIHYTIEAIQKAGRDIDILGVLACNVDNRTNSLEKFVVQPMIKQKADHFLFKNHVRQSKLAHECEAAGMTLFQHKRQSVEKVVNDYRQVVRELVYRIRFTDDYFDGKLLEMEEGCPEDFDAHKATAATPEQVAETV